MSVSVKSLAAPSWPLFVLAPVVCCIALAVVFADGLAEMISVWFSREEYSHGVLIPAIAAYLAWRQRDALLSRPLTPSPSGIVVIVVAVLLNLLGKLGAVFALQQYAFVLALYGVAATLTGWRGVSALWAPLLVLLFMVPLPNFILNNLSSQLQLLSSQLGVWFIRLFDIAVFVEGNVIDLGGYKLQVAEACDGLRYLFPLLTMSFIIAYLFKTAMWKRVLLFLSAIPLTILMNSLRVGMIGVMVDRWGVRMAEGFLHDFQGWAIFMVSAALLFAELIVLAQIGRDRAPWRTVFDVAAPAAAAGGSHRMAKLPEPFVAGTIVLAVFAVLLLALPTRTEAVPRREPFLSFPAQIGAWSGSRSALEQIYLDTLQLDDYVLADYRRGRDEVVNLYVAWYDSQRAGQSAHSPRSCLPGGGWRITSLRQMEVTAVRAQPLLVNRAQIELGNQKQLVYYWFQQRGRVITNEYVAKWYLFWDSLTRGRTDGALVRLVTPIPPGEDVQAADARLAGFLEQAEPQLARHIPD